MEAFKKKAEESLSSIKCPKCGKSFSTKDELVAHGKTHAQDGADNLTSQFKL